MALAKIGRTLAPIIDNNPITQQILGICSALAVTTSLSTALTMSLALTAVLVCANAIISAIRHHVPTSVRLIVQITIIASLVIVIDLIIQAYAFSISQRLSIFVALIVTNCLVLGRAEAFAMHNPVGASILDALVNAAGYAAILILVGTLRELLGLGTLLGYPVIATTADGGSFTPLALMLLAPSAFIILGLLVWLIRTARPALAEPAAFAISHRHSGARHD